eukprot:TRINITY_DN105977_c0_g1_i1.p1 TRINITY_DN105977_c0_g1~~TRINITY_DN105977_c0_g1_i1.p1  ORF type:complete len:416 (+),score=15.56 TRINITY_DN105977_c0_g1_i1:1115-2362(+)
MDQEREKTSSSVPLEESKTDWLLEQDAQLQNLVATYGTKDWGVISDALNAVFPQRPRSGRQCCGRWQDLLEAESAKRAWTEQDELSMIIAHKKYKNRWADISESLKGRSNNTIKNKFYSVFRKIRGKIIKCDCSYVSKLELLEIHYIVSLIEQYLAHPMLVPKPKGKRGKDFIYSLIHNLNEKMVADYKAKMQELTKSEGTMEELFSKLSAQLKASTEKSNGTIPVKPILAPQNHVIERPRVRMTGGIHRREEVEPVHQREQKLYCEPVRIEDDKLLSGGFVQREGLMENSPLFGHGHFSPPFLFSPNTLSAGPAAAAAGAARAACFGNDFSEISYIAKSYGERPRNEFAYQVPRPVPTQNRGVIQRQHTSSVASSQPQVYSNLAAKPHYYFTQSHNNQHQYQYYISSYKRSEAS